LIIKDLTILIYEIDLRRHFAVDSTLDYEQNQYP
jgi:hypothetical protein